MWREDHYIDYIWGETGMKNGIKVYKLCKIWARVSYSKKRKKQA